jgi:hypothetical protein
MANFFSTRATKGLIKIGNIYCPQNGDFPAYETIAGTWKLNDLAANVPADDFNSLNLVLAIFSFLPNFVLVWLVGLFQKSQSNPSDGIIASTLRQLNIGLAWPVLFHLLFRVSQSAVQRQETVRYH